MGTLYQGVLERKERLNDKLNPKGFIPKMAAGWFRIVPFMNSPFFFVRTRGDTIRTSDVAVVRPMPNGDILFRTKNTEYVLHIMMAFDELEP